MVCKPVAIFHLKIGKSFGVNARMSLLKAKRNSSPHLEVDFRPKTAAKMRFPLLRRSSIKISLTVLRSLAVLFRFQIILPSNSREDFFCIKRFQSLQYERKGTKKKAGHKKICVSAKSHSDFILFYSDSEFVFVKSRIAKEQLSRSCEAKQKSVYSPFRILPLPRWQNTWLTKSIPGRVAFSIPNILFT